MCEREGREREGERERERERESEREGREREREGGMVERDDVLKGRTNSCTSP